MAIDLKRRLEANKQTKILTVNKRPIISDGENGDMRMRNNILYIKNQNKWYSMRMDEVTNSNNESLEKYSFGTNGYMQFSSGFMVQWGVYDGVTNGATITFPVPFPNNCFLVSSTSIAETITNSSNIAGQTYDHTVTNFKIKIVSGHDGSDAGAVDDGFNWIALGN